MKVVLLTVTALLLASSAPAQEREHVRSRTMMPPAALPPDAGRLPLVMQPSIPAGEPTASEAAAFVAEVEAAYTRSFEYGNRISWIKNTNITVDTNWLETLANAEASRAQLGFVKRAARFANVAVDPDTRRKLDKIKLGALLPPPDRPDASNELAGLTTRLSSFYSTNTVAYQGSALQQDEADELIGDMRDPKELQTLWLAMRSNLPPMIADFTRVIELSNAGARELGFNDVGEMWRSSYDMPPEAFAALVDRLWKQIEPLYRNMQCYRRARLNEAFGSGVQPRTGPIRADLLAPKWETLADIMLPKTAGTSIDLTKILAQKDYDVEKIFKTGEGFFTSLGFAPLPKSFWERSMFARPRDREVSCWASAWHIDGKDDVRIQGCFRANADNFYIVHHELGHTYYQLSYQNQSATFADAANDGFHEAIGDFIALSAQTPTYLQQIGLLDPTAQPESDIAHLMRMLDSYGYSLAANLTMEKWRWDVFSGKIAPAQYNDAWWKLRLEYLGVAPPASRSAGDFDPGAVYHIANFVPVVRYFLATVYQFQFHRAACRIAGWTGPLHRCSVYGNKAVGDGLKAMLSMGASKPWPEALAAFTGSREMDATAILDYFAPLDRWLTEQNKGETCGW